MLLQLNCINLRGNSRVLEIRELKKTYIQPGGERLPILDIAEFQLSAGEQVALVGQSGSGKSTLLNVIAGITSADSGSVRVAGAELTRLPEAGRDLFRSSRIGYVFQTFHLLPALTALENVLLGMSFGGVAVDRGKAIRLLERVGLKHRLNHRPTQLSVGEQQRTSVARALAKTPVLLLADEPTASVDAANQHTILSLLRDACTESNVSLLLVTHAAEVAKQFARVEELSRFNRAAVGTGASS